MFKITAKYYEKNKRLEINERHQITLEVQDIWDMDRTCYEVLDKIRTRVQKDSKITIISYKCGQRLFRINY